ncbi:1-alkyl-2-acetylglycerophosphocholine esterase [Sediminicola sp. YIK13]|uniref:asparaginase n=1 Tax=Sediminicola sp. YIK13 TaxID=1453352 RepID=UPI0007209396|nr:asparaginase [Sediminicola sp. YIK13]ALM09333.1 1-alkyl-2-acetylglycerophosphocholine esterase [Sediminicola sp. YIK13]
MEDKTKIMLIYTGGTIGMVKDYSTGALKAFNFKKLEKHIPELSQLDCSIDSVSFDTPIDSSNMNITHWVSIATMIEEHYENYDGFVVLHGSDTMSYTSSALSYMLEHLAKPVIFTGSQLPIGDLRTDAKENLITSIQIAALQNGSGPVIKEVCLYFEYKLYRANRTTKFNAEHFEAFGSLNYPELVESGVHLKVHYDHLWVGNRNKKFIVHKKMDDNVAILKLFPGLKRSVLQSILKIPGLKALVLETYGAGNAPTDAWLLQDLKDAIDGGLHIVNVTQCSGGSVIMGQYETSEHLQKLQLINGKDITTEAAITKLMYLLGSNVSAKLFKTIFETSLRGEMQ